MIDGACKFVTGTNVENLCVWIKMCRQQPEKRDGEKKERKQCNDDYWFMPKDWSHSIHVALKVLVEDQMLLLLIKSHKHSSKVRVHIWFKKFLAQEAENIHQKANMQS